MQKIINPVTRILNLVKLEHKEITSIYFFAILSGLIQLSLPLGVQAIIGFVMGGAMSTSLVLLISLVIIGVFLTGLIQISQMQIIEKIQQKLFVRYSLLIAEKIPQLDLKKADSHYLPELTNRFFDISILQKGLSKLLLEIPTASIQIFFGLMLLAFYHPAFILFGILLSLTLWLILYVTGNKGLQTSLEESGQKYSLAGWLEEMARVAKSLKFANAVDFHLRKTDQGVSGYLNSRTSHFKILLQQFYSLLGFKVIITAAMLIVGSILLVNQQLNIGQFIAAEIVIILVINSIEKIIGNLNNVYDVLTAVEKLSNITDLPDEQSGKLSFQPGRDGVAISFRNVSFGYKNENPVVRNVSFEIKPGEKVAITGQEGTGKSTLLKLLAGAYVDFDGVILIDNIPIGNYDLQSLRSQTGVMLHQQDIFQGTLLENITMGNESISIDRINELANKTGLLNFISKLNNGYDTLVDASGNRLPRNMVHKILLTRALAHQPQLLLLEDPWVSLEKDNRKQLQEFMLNEFRNSTMLVVTADKDYHHLCDRIIHVTDSGCKIIEGTNLTPSGGEGI